MQLHFECRTTVLLLFDVVPIEVEYRIRSSKTVIHILFMLSYLSLSWCGWRNAISASLKSLYWIRCRIDFSILIIRFSPMIIKQCLKISSSQKYSSMKNNYKKVSFISISFCINSWSVLIGNNNKILIDILVSPSYSLLLVYNLHNVCTTMYW